MVPILVAAVAVAAVVAWQVVPRTTNAQAGGPTAVASGSPSASASLRSTQTPSPSPGTDAQAGDDAATQLKSCRQRVDRADTVLAAAKTGATHWAEHVQAQTDANDGRITVAEMNAIFARTRLAGPDDQDHYRKALSAYEDDDGSCSSVDGASTKEAAALSSCRDRRDAQRPVLKAAAPAMADWKSHLAAMTRSRMHHMDDAEQIWVDAWRAAPPHIKAYEKAADAFGGAPDC